MSTMNVSLPAALKRYVDEQANTRGYSSSSEYLRELIRSDQERSRLRQFLIDGAESGIDTTVDIDYFAELRRF